MINITLMHNFYKKMLASALLAATAAGVSATPVGPRNFDITRHAYKAAKSVGSPAFSISASDMIGDLDTPGGELWFYTSNMVYKTIEHEYYKEKVLLEYSFDIYNSSAELVGTIHDKMRYEENEVRTVECSIVPMVTRNFFNDDDKYEIMIGLGVNRTKVYDDGTTEWLPNSYRSVIYSLGGEKETLEVEDSATGETVSREFDKPVYKIEGSLGDVLDASVEGKEQVFLTFYDESLPEYGDDDIIMGDDGPVVSDAFWNSLTAAHITARVCGKVGADGTMPELLRFEIPILSLPGDQEGTPFMISLRDGDDAYYVVQYYKEVFYNRYDSPTDDLTMREHNSLMVDLYKVADGDITKVNTTEIPFVMDSKDRLLFSFHSLGDFRYAEDVRFNEDGKLSFLVTKNNFFADEHSEYSYYHYASDGKKINNIFENAESNLPMSDVEGHDPQQMFVTYGNGEYIFHFVDLPSGVEKAAFSCYLETDPDSDPDMMTSNIDRTKVGDSYRYAAEMRTPSVDENDNTIMRIAWLDDKGGFLRMDEVNMGQNVLYARCYIDGFSLQNDLFLTDEPNEYMLLVKRGVDLTTTEEHLLIAQAMSPSAPDGLDVLLLTPCEKGALSTINPYTMLDQPMLHVYYYDADADKVSLDVYTLPFDDAAVKEIEWEGTAAAMTFNGMEIFSAGNEISVFSLQGSLLRKGVNAVKVDDLGAGVYVAVAGGAARKFVVR